MLLTSNWHCSKRLNQLPKIVQEQAKKAYNLWKENPYHPSLQFKRVSQRHPLIKKTLTIPGKDGDDVPIYLEKQLTKLISQLQQSRENEDS